MSSYLYLDHNSLAYAYQGGGTALLDRIAVYAAQQGYELRISDVVRGEIEAGPLRKELGGWLQSKGLSSGLPTQTLLQVITGEIPSKSAGDVSIVELAKSDIAAGNRVTVWADDEFFTRSQNLRGLPNGFNSTGVQGTSTLINQMAADGAMTPGEYVTTVESFRSKVQPFIQDPRGYSPRLDQFPSATELEGLKSSLSSLPQAEQSGALKQFMLQKGYYGLKALAIVRPLVRFNDITGEFYHR